ncbi:cytochrome P450 76A2-like [Actinidia eriantha]|uniref:cytochrome P450 76A2-like n=1 Tax=Actinidia eriantha TaxID=165200 RepID=UPI00258ED34D|nr:cytochrome P450 76A2-like [Actinidia eriantha]
MEWAWSPLFWFLTILSSTILLLFRHRKTSGPTRLPPGPPGWPLVGHMFDLGPMPHHTLAGLTQKYGPVIWLRASSKKTMVVQTAKAAEELFRNHDLSFADRSINNLMTSHNYNKGSLALACYGPYWRVLRRICTVEMLVVKRVNETVPVRRKCIDDLLSWIESQVHWEAHGLHVAHFVFLASFNMLGNLMLSRDLVDPESKEGSELFEAIMGLMEWTGHPNIADLFPWLGWFDLQGLRRKMDRDMGNALRIASGYVRERVKERQARNNVDHGGGGKRQDFLDVLLDFEGNGKDEPEKIPDHNVNVFILEIFMAGSETTSATTEWAMTELLCHPKTMTKLKSELSSVIRPGRKMEETDIDNLPYLQAVVKETLRLHPPIPFLVPRQAIQDTDFMGYHIPKNTKVLVNTWAIGRDPECWADPLEFKPERFLGSKVEYKGQSYEMIPFGAGRRMCAGIPLAHRMLHLVLGSLVHEFEWELYGGITSEMMDRREKMGVTVRKLKPLIVVPRKIVR